MHNHGRSNLNWSFSCCVVGFISYGEDDFARNTVVRFQPQLGDAPFTRLFCLIQVNVNLPSYTEERRLPHFSPAFRPNLPDAFLSDHFIGVVHAPTSISVLIPFVGKTSFSVMSSLSPLKTSMRT